LQGSPQFTIEQLQALSDEDLTELVLLTERLKYVTENNKLADYHPYPKQLEFHVAGAIARERLFMASNQTGKTWGGAFEAAIHMTGRYPDWWTGYRFNRPTRGMCGSESTELTKKGVQRLLLGNPETPEKWGSGSIPRGSLVNTVRHQGVPNAVSAIIVKHVSGGESVCTTASYDQGRTKWQADTLDWVWFDEEPPEDVYMEGITRTNVQQGPVWITFTPLLGMSKVVRRFYPTMSAFPNTHVTHATIDDALHYTQAQREAIIASYPEHERAARARGLPALGSGRVFAEIAREDIQIKPFPIPAHWHAIGGIDFGWDHPSAAVKIVWDKDNDIEYLIAAYRKRQCPPLTFSATIKPWGDRMPWAWPHDGKQSGGKFDAKDNKELSAIYRGHGLNMLPIHAQNEDGSNGLEGSVATLNERMMTDKFKVFSHLSEVFEEIDNYHRKDGLIVKENDDIISATRYARMMRRFSEAVAMPGQKRPARVHMPGGGQGWMG
jgi:phage terminase large subunit-like protein